VEGSQGDRGLKLLPCEEEQGLLGTEKRLLQVDLTAVPQHLQRGHQGDRALLFSAMQQEAERQQTN